MADHTTGHGAIRGKGCPGCCADAIETVLDEEEIERALDTFMPDLNGQMPSYIVAYKLRAALLASAGVASKLSLKGEGR